MVEVRVRDQHQIDRRQIAGRQRALDEAQRAYRAEADGDANPAEQYRVGEDAHAVEVDQHGGVSEPRQRNGVVVPAARRRTMRCGRHLAAEFLDAAADEAGRPRLGHAGPGTGAGQRASADEVTALHNEYYIVLR
jgi:hypothetical protein